MIDPREEFLEILLLDYLENGENDKQTGQVEVVTNSKERVRDIVHIAGTVWVTLSKSTKIVILAAETKQILRVVSLKVRNR